MSRCLRLSSSVILEHSIFSKPQSHIHNANELNFSLFVLQIRKSNTDF